MPPYVNFTIDDTDDTAIEYYPPDCEGLGWAHAPDDFQHYGRTFTYCQSNGTNNPTAVFRFTGVAVYFLMRRFDRDESMYLSLDGQPRSFVNLTSPGCDCFAYEVLWSATNLSDQQHTLELLPGEPVNGRAYVRVDAFTVTAVEGSYPIPSQESSSPFPEPSSTPVLSSASSSLPPATRLNLAAVVVGVGATISLAILAFILWRRRKMKNEEGSIYSVSDKVFMPVRRSSPTLSSQPTDPMEVLRMALPDSVFPLPISQDTIIARLELPDLASPITSSQISDPRRSPSLSSLPIAIRELPDLTSPVLSSQISYPRMVVASPTTLFNDCGANGEVTVYPRNLVERT